MRLSDIIERAREDRQAKKIEDRALGPFHFIHPSGKEEVSANEIEKRSSVS